MTTVHGEQAAEGTDERAAEGGPRVGRQDLWQIIKFGMVGGVNTATFYASYLLLHPHLPYFLAYTIAFVLSMIGSFFMNTYFTYRTKPTWAKFIRFPLTNVTNYVITSVGTVLLVSGIGMNNKIAPLVAAIAAIPFTFVLSRKILTRTA